MKKLLLGLGSIMTVVAPVAAVISCGDSKAKNADTTKTTIKNGEASLSIVLKDIITRAYPSIHTEDIKDAKILEDGYNIRIGALTTKMDYAVQYTFNKEMNIEITPFNEEVKDGTKVVFAVRKLGGLTKVVLQNVGSAKQREHTITGSQKNLIIEMLKKQGMTIDLTPVAETTQTEQTQPVAEQHETQVTEVQTPVVTPTQSSTTQEQTSNGGTFDFSADAKIFQDHGAAFDTSRTNEELMTLDPNADLTAEQLDIALPKLSAGVTVTFRIDGNSPMPVLHKGDEEFIVPMFITFQHVATPQYKAAPFDFSADAKIFQDHGATFETTKSQAELMGLDPEADLQAEQLGITLPVLSTGVTVTFRIDGNSPMPILHKGDEQFVIPMFIRLEQVAPTIIAPPEPAPEVVQGDSFETAADSLDGKTFISSKTFDDLDNTLHDASFEVDGYASFSPSDLGLDIEVPQGITVDLELNAQVADSNNFEMFVYLQKGEESYQGEVNIIIAPSPTIHHSLGEVDTQQQGEPQPEAVIAPPM